MTQQADCKHEFQYRFNLYPRELLKKRTCLKCEYTEALYKITSYDFTGFSFRDEGLKWMEYNDSTY